MIELRKAIKSYLESICPRVYSDEAPDIAIFPYLVFSANAYPDGTGFENVILDIDGWDSNDLGDTLPVETLMQSLKPFDKYTIETDTLTVTFYLDSKSRILDTDNRIKRRKNIYTGKLFNKE